jgi:hypothetical protein
VVGRFEGSKLFFYHKKPLGSDINCDDDKFNPHVRKHNLLTIYHQNICGLSNKVNELITFLHPHFPDVLCLTEHQFKTGTIITFLS